jgi:hypothetical protein
VVFLAMLAAALFWGAFRESGAVGAVVALGALGLSTLAADSVRFGLIDCVVAALVMIALVARGRMRVACLFAAGLARPEAWLLCGVAGYTEATGNRGRRIVAGALAAGVAPLVWLLVDLCVSGDPLASYHRAHRIVPILERRFHPVALSQIPTAIWSAVGHDVGMLIVVVGATGIFLHARSGVAGRSFDPLPISVLVVWALMIAIETRAVPFESRYLYGATMPLLLGVAAALRRGLPARVRGGKALATLGAVTVFALTTEAMPTTTSASYRALAAAVPAIDRALACDPVAITGSIRNTFAHRPAAFAPVLAALTHHGLNQFKVESTGRDLAAVVVLGSENPDRPTAWVRQDFGFLTVAVAPGCDGRGHRPVS